VPEVFWVAVLAVVAALSDLGRLLLAVVARSVVPDGILHALI